MQGARWQDVVEAGGDASEADGDVVYLRVEVHPGASRSGIEGHNPWRARIVIAVRSPPTGGRANEEVAAIVADLLGVPAAGVSITAGARGRRKTVAVQGRSRAEVLEALALRLASKG